MEQLNVHSLNILKSKISYPEVNSFRLSHYELAMLEAFNSYQFETTMTFIKEYANRKNTDDKQLVTFGCPDPQVDDHIQ